MQRVGIIAVLSLLAVLVMAGTAAGAIYIDRTTIFYPGTTDVYADIAGENSITALTNKAATLSNHGKYEEALKTIDQAIKINPTIGQPYYNKGLILYNMGRYDEALKAFDWGVRIDPGNKFSKYRDQILKKPETSST